MKFKSNIFNLVLTLIATQSCASWVESAKKMIDGDVADQKKKETKWVSQSQYNDLLIKYNTLNQENERLKQVELAKSDEAPNYNQIDELSQSIDSSDAIDVFKDEKLTSEMNDTNVESSEVSKLVAIYNKALTLKQNGKLKIALGMFQKLEKSSVEQVIVRSKYQVAQIYYNQNQFDLALQVYESIISKNSFSSIVLDALNGAVLCSESLGLQDKKMRYQSVLQDFFGINS